MKRLLMFLYLPSLFGDTVMVWQCVVCLGGGMVCRAFVGWRVAVWCRSMVSRRCSSCGGSVVDLSTVFCALSDVIYVDLTPVTLKYVSYHEAQIRFSKRLCWRSFRSEIGLLMPLPPPPPPPLPQPPPPDQFEMHRQRPDTQVNEPLLNRCFTSAFC